MVWQKNKGEKLKTDECGGANTAFSWGFGYIALCFLILNSIGFDVPNRLKITRYVKAQTWTLYKPVARMPTLQPKWRCSHCEVVHWLLPPKPTLHAHCAGTGF